MWSRCVRRPSVCLSVRLSVCPWTNSGTFCNRWSYWTETWYICPPWWQLPWDQIRVQSDSSFGHQGAIRENTKMAITLLILIGFCWDFYGVYLWWGGITYGTGFWFDLLFKVTEVKVRQITETWHVSLLIELGCWKLVWMCVLRPYTCVLNWSPFRLQTWLPGGHLEKHPFTSLSWSDRVMML